MILVHIYGISRDAPKKGWLAKGIVDAICTALLQFRIDPKSIKVTGHTEPRIIGEITVEVERLPTTSCELISMTCSNVLGSLHAYTYGQLKSIERTSVKIIGLDGSCLALQTSTPFNQDVPLKKTVPPIATRFFIN